MVLSALAMVISALVWASGVLDEGKVDALCGEECPQLLSERIGARAGRSAWSMRRAWRPPPPGWRPCRPENTAPYSRRRFRRQADAGRPSPPRPYDAAGDEDAPHVGPGLFQKSLAAHLNAILTTSMSVSVGSPASLPRRWT